MPVLIGELVAENRTEDSVVVLIYINPTKVTIKVSSQQEIMRWVNREKSNVERAVKISRIGGTIGRRVAAKNVVNYIKH